MADKQGERVAQTAEQFSLRAQPVHARFPVEESLMDRVERRLFVKRSARQSGVYFACVHIHTVEYKIISPYVSVFFRAADLVRMRTPLAPLVKIPVRRGKIRDQPVFLHAGIENCDDAFQHAADLL